jgi:glucose-6-phosphate 1-dehydrogenase
MTDFFKQTSDAPYIQNDYVVETLNGKTTLFHDWEEMQAFWQTFAPSLRTVHIKSKKRGFGK